MLFVWGFDKKILGCRACKQAKTLFPLVKRLNFEIPI